MDGIDFFSSQCLEKEIPIWDFKFFQSNSKQMGAMNLTVQQSTPRLILVWLSLLPSLSTNSGV